MEYVMHIISLYVYFITFIYNFFFLNEHAGNWFSSWRIWTHNSWLNLMFLLYLISKPRKAQLIKLAVCKTASSMLFLISTYSMFLKPDLKKINRPVINLRIKKYNILFLKMYIVLFLKWFSLFIKKWVRIKPMYFKCSRNDAISIYITRTIWQ